MKAIQSIFILFALLLLVQPTYSQAVKESRYGYAYADNAVIRTFISPIQKEWGNLVSVVKVNKNTEKYTFDNNEQVTVVFLTVRENIIAGHSILQIDKIWQIKKAKSK